MYFFDNVSILLYSSILKGRLLLFKYFLLILSISTIVLVVTFLIAETKHLTKAPYGIRWFSFVVGGKSIMVWKAHRQKKHDAADHIIATVRKERVMHS